MSEHFSDMSAKPITEFNDGLVALFQSFMLNEDYEEAVDFVDSCPGFVPTPFVVNEIVFKIMIDCNENLAYAAADYLEIQLREMSTCDDQKVNFLKALNDQSNTHRDIWDVFSHFVWSSLHHLKISEADNSNRDYLNRPNCDLLVHIYIKAFLNCSIKSDILGSRAAERVSCLLNWINLYYKHNVLEEPGLKNLQSLLDYIVDSEISSDPSLPPCVKFQTVNLSQYIYPVLNICKDVFATAENQQAFFNCSWSPYLITKVCQYRLQELLGEKMQPNSGPLTLKSIVDNYFFQRPEKTVKPKGSPRKSSLRKKLKKFSKDAIPGDTDFHVHCRLGRCADLLCTMFADLSRDINTRNKAGNTPLHEACLASSYLCSKFLIDDSGDRKVNFTATDNEGRTPLHCAVYVDATDIVKLLLDRGGNHLIKCQDDYGSTPIDYSTSEEMRKLLQEVESKLIQEDESKLEEKEGVTVKLEGTVYSTRESSDLPQLKLRKIKNCKDLHLYLRTLRNFVSNYCEIYDLPKTESDVKILPHDSKECYHYKAGRKTLCMEDSLMLDSFYNVIKAFISCAELVAKEENAKQVLKHYNIFAAEFK